MKNAWRNFVVWVALFAIGIFPAIQASASFEISTLENQIFKKRALVQEFRKIAEMADQLKVRVYIFGGSAATFAHYVKWDLQRQNGDSLFEESIFDFHFSNIFRSAQDIDLVVDGSLEQASELQRMLENSPIHQLRGKKSIWDIRLLRGVLGNRSGLLDDFNFQNQHSDSHSTGLIELSSSDTSLLKVKDVRDWNSSPSKFLKDVYDGRLHYYFSSRHGETERAKLGLNPPIFSVIRYFIKAFQFGLEMDPDDIHRLSQLISDFNPQLPEGYQSEWIDKNAPHLIHYAIDIERAWNILESTGLRDKLISIQKSFYLTELMERTPLRTFPLGMGEGKTAAELGLEFFAHDTRSMDAYESLTRSPNGQVNALASPFSSPDYLQNLHHVTEGFYAFAGNQGIHKNGLTIQFRLDPKARIGSDFVSQNPLLTGEFIILNKAAIRRLPSTTRSTYLNISTSFHESLDVQDLDFYRHFNEAQLNNFRRRFSLDLSHWTHVQIQSFQRKIILYLKDSSMISGNSYLYKIMHYFNCAQLNTWIREAAETYLFEDPDFILKRYIHVGIVFYDPNTSHFALESRSVKNRLLRHIGSTASEDELDRFIQEIALFLSKSHYFSYAPPNILLAVRLLIEQTERPFFPEIFEQLSLHLKKYNANATAKSAGFLRGIIDSYRKINDSDLSTPGKIQNQPFLTSEMVDLLIKHADINDLRDLIMCEGFVLPDKENHLYLKVLKGLQKLREIYLRDNIPIYGARDIFPLLSMISGRILLAQRDEDFILTLNFLYEQKDPQWNDAFLRDLIKPSYYSASVQKQYLKRFRAFLHHYPDDVDCQAVLRELL